jgi:hypothetical protein
LRFENEEFAAEEVLPQRRKELFSHRGHRAHREIE